MHDTRIVSMHTHQATYFIVLFSFFAWMLSGPATKQPVLIADSFAQDTLPYDRILPGIAEIPKPKPTVAPRILGIGIRQVRAETVHEQKTIHVPILMYHYVRYVNEHEDKAGYLLSVTPDNFEKQLAYIREKGFTTISPQELYDSLFQGSTLPVKPVLLTFDDGYHDFFTEGLRLIEKYNVKVTIFVPTDRINTPGYMSWEQVRTISQNPNITVASHTRHHLSLSTTVIDQLDNEITQSRLILERELGRSIDFFAYPYGSFNGEVIKEVKKAGYKLAFSTINGRSHTVDDQYTLKRLNVSGAHTIEDFSRTLGM